MPGVKPTSSGCPRTQPSTRSLVGDAGLLRLLGGDLDRLGDFERSCLFCFDLLRLLGLEVERGKDEGHRVEPT